MSRRTAMDNLLSAAALTRAHEDGDGAGYDLVTGSTPPLDLIGGLVSLVRLTADLLRSDPGRELADVLDGIVDVNTAERGGLIPDSI